MTSPAQYRFIRLCHLRQRFETAASTASVIPGLHRIPDQTVRNRLREAGIRGMRPVRGVVLTAQHRQKPGPMVSNSYDVATRNVWFSDESRFLPRTDGRARVYRRRNERFAANFVQQVDRFSGGSVMVWGAISHTGKSTLVHIQGTKTAQIYRDQILRPHVLRLMKRNDAIFQHENARPHTARLTNVFLYGQYVQVPP